MKLFSRETPANPEVAGPAASGDPRNPDLEALTAHARKGRRSPASANAARLEEVARQAELEGLFQDENWEEVGALYFNARYAMTGFEPFKLNERERKILATTMATTMKTLLKIDPAYVALIVFTINYGALITGREIQYSEVVRQEKARREAAKAPAGASADAFKER